MLADHYKNGDIPKEAITFQEEQGRQAFEDGKLLFLRNWPYVYNLAKHRRLLQGQGQVRRRSAAGRLRPRRLHPRWSQRGASAPTPSTRRTALDFLKFLTRPPSRRPTWRRARWPRSSSRSTSDQAARREVPLPPDPADLHQERRAAPGHAVLPGGHQGDPGQRLRRDPRVRRPVDQAVKDMQSAMQSASQRLTGHAVPTVRGWLTGRPRTAYPARLSRTSTERTSVKEQA